MGVRPRQRLWGFSQLNYIQRQSPADAHTHIHIHLINMDTHIYIESGVKEHKRSHWVVLIGIKQRSDEVGSFSSSSD